MVRRGGIKWERRQGHAEVIACLLNGVTKWLLVLEHGIDLTQVHLHERAAESVRERVCRPVIGYVPSLHAHQSTTALSGHIPKAQQPAAAMWQWRVELIQPWVRAELNPRIMQAVCASTGIKAAITRNVCAVHVARNHIISQGWRRRCRGRRWLWRRGRRHRRQRRFGWRRYRRR